MRMWAKGNPSLLSTGRSIKCHTVDITEKVPDKAGNELLLDSTIQPLNRHSEVSIPSDRGTCSSMFFDAVFTRARKQDQLVVHQLMDNENVVHINNEIFFSHKGK